MNSNSHPALLKQYPALLTFAERIHLGESLPWSLDRPPVVLTIAGSDPTGGAGIQADLKTFSALGTHGLTVITTITAQNTRGVESVHPLPAKIVRDQLRALKDFDIRAVKIGMIGSLEIVRMLEQELAMFEHCPIVLDPIVQSSSGMDFLGGQTAADFFDTLLSTATLVTPNIPEAEALTETQIESIDAMEYAAKRLVDRYGAAVLLKGGHRESIEATDILVIEEETYPFSTPRIESERLHGTGCTLSSAIVAALGFGCELVDAVRIGKEFVTGAIESATHRKN
ncbi:MAG TPA: bifunctional hydroxymethylpyrimidine kinase/phosphomethylpyrimidine kinase, partial [Candidatus Kapabacteria bacterium]|nr:bifunctional hydroxymethylpyrimidine kinase/phosphomethylpyrimidine kinase [Candidatus Kapabacteria bacterium]